MQDRPPLTPKEAAPLLGYSEDHLRTLCREGRIPGARQLQDGGRWLIPVAAVREIINGGLPE
jgi:excisionase family DNA binding protein